MFDRLDLLNYWMDFNAVFSYSRKRFGFIKHAYNVRRNLRFSMICEAKMKYIFTNDTARVVSKYVFHV